MSWDIKIINSAQHIPIEDVRDEKSIIPSFGKREALISRVKKQFPEMKWSGNEGFPFVESDVIVFNCAFGKNEYLGNAFTLHVHDGENPVKFINQICNMNNWSAYDLQTDSYLELIENNDKSWNEFESYRDKECQHLLTSKEKKRWWRFW